MFFFLPLFLNFSGNLVQTRNILLLVHVVLFLVYFLTCMIYLIHNFIIAYAFKVWIGHREWEKIYKETNIHELFKTCKMYNYFYCLSYILPNITYLIKCISDVTIVFSISLVGLISSKRCIFIGAFSFVKLAYYHDFIQVTNRNFGDLVR